MSEERDVWNRHWVGLQEEHRLVGVLASAIRKVVLCRAVRHYADRFFSSEGWFLEAGCGTAESSARIRTDGRRLVGLDLSLQALRRARLCSAFHSFVCADIRQLPFEDRSLAGVWNLGVMEHFAPEVGREILLELRRVLAPRGVLLLFWPPTFGLSRWALAPLEWVKSRRSKRPFRFFPDEVNRLRSKGAGAAALREADLEVAAVSFAPRVGFNHLVVVGRKPLQ